jgi:hypothetical protein
MSNTNTLKDYAINIKIKLAGLWTSAMFCFVYGDYFQLYTPDKVSDLLSGDNNLDSPMKLFIASLLMAIPSLMIILSLVLKPRINKWLNIIFGLMFTLMMLLIAVLSLTPWYGFYVFLALVETTLTALIVWTAFRWPNENN